MMDDENAALLTRIADLEAQIKVLEAEARESTMQELASLGQAQEAYEAQIAAETALAAERAKVAKLVEALRLIELIGYREGEDFGWINAHMRGVATSALTGESIEHYWRLFPKHRAAITEAGQ